MFMDISLSVIFFKKQSPAFIVKRHLPKPGTAPGFLKIYFL
jgi:hypothetical protein